MGYLMKEALKALCGVNQWSYAVFWKIGCQNPKLLIWEEFYYEVYPSSNTATGNTLQKPGMNLQKLQSYQNGTQVDDGVHFLVDKMMMSNQVNVVGEGLVGRAAFTGNYQWIVSGTHNEFSYPAEVLHEINLQFSSGINTIAVIPVIPHGVVQFGSRLTIPENTGFVHDVRSLIIHLGGVPSTFVSDNYITKDDCISGLPASNATVNPFVAGSCNLRRNSSDCVANQSSNSLLTQFQDNLQVSGSSFMVNNLTQDSCKFQADRTGGTLTPLTHDYAMNQLRNNPGSQISFPQSSASCSQSDHLVSVSGPATVISSMKNEMEAAHADKMFHEAALKTVEQPRNSSQLTNVPYYGNYNNDSVHTAKCIPNQVKDIDMHDVLKTLSKSQEQLSFGSFPSEDLHDQSHVLPSNNFISDDSFFQSATGDDLFDVLGMDFKKNLLNPNDSKLLQTYDPSLGSHSKGLTRSMNSQSFGSGIFRDYEGVSESGVFSSGSDHLLDAMISGVSSASKQTSEDSMSCRTTVSKISSSSVPSTPRNTSSHPPPSVGLFTMADSMQRHLFGLSKSVGEPLGRSIGSLGGKNEGGICSTPSSTYGGSKFNSWTDQGHTSSVSTANSKKGDEGGKANRKRLKPGENPRPRPKDRQMIQDRVKELREIVPNGAKCSIDSLLERTIKHMLFLQSIANHADKLKHTVESKVNRKEAGTLLQDNFEGGATWAFELGSQSMVCPIVVEDLNPPRQLLVEMLCEERGFFLEIADIIRGLGLTILKGVMEARNDKIWGRFAVEADRDVTRMEVFISLVHLLEQTLNSNPAPGNGGDENVVYPAAAKQPLVGPIVCGEPPAM